MTSEQVYEKIELWNTMTKNRNLKWLLKYETRNMFCSDWITATLYFKRFNVDEKKHD